ncbi:hypothetical protein JL722_5651 [Aureococcus anophagefferens]|nr:hypothetical protein JL722_5651 [Aureococcus anophagefferens]
MGADDDDHVVLEHDAPKDAAALKAEKLAKLAKLKGEAAGAPAKRFRPDGTERFNHIHLTDDDDEHTAIAKGRHIPAPKPPPPPKVEPPRHHHHKEQRKQRKANKKMSTLGAAGGFFGVVFLLLYWLRKLIIESEEKATVKAKKKDFNRWDPRAGGAGAAWSKGALPPSVKKAAQRGERGAVLQWAQGGGDANARDADGKTALHHACNHGHAELARSLVESGCSPDAADAGGETPLHCAAKAGSASAVRVLLDAGADVSAETSKGRETPAMLAGTAGNHGCARLIQRREREMTSNAAAGETTVLRRAGKGCGDATDGSRAGAAAPASRPRPPSRGLPYVTSLHL